MQENKAVLIIGLGNPGLEYKSTRHNVGFIAVDFLAGMDAKWKKEKNAFVAKGENNTIFVKPQTFMNNSGVSVQALMTFYKIPIENLIVIHDDIDLVIGDVRIKTGGSSGGHNGIKSIDTWVGREYKRIRIGVGHPRDTDSPIDPSDWVLGKFSKPELAKINTVIKELNVF